LVLFSLPLKVYPAIFVFHESAIAFELAATEIRDGTPLMLWILGGPLRLNERTADNIFSGWILPSRSLMLKKILHFLS